MHIQIVFVANIAPKTNLDAVLAAHHSFRKNLLYRNRAIGAREILTVNDLEGAGILFGIPGMPRQSLLVDVYKVRLAGVRSIAALNNEWSRQGGLEYDERRLTKDERRLLRCMSWSNTILDLSTTKPSTTDAAIKFIRREHLVIPLMVCYPGETSELPDAVTAEIDNRGGYVGGDFKEFLFRSLPQV